MVMGLFHHLVAVSTLCGLTFVTLLVNVGNDVTGLFRGLMFLLSMLLMIVVVLPYMLLMTLVLLSWMERMVL